MRAARPACLHLSIALIAVAAALAWVPAPAQAAPGCEPGEVPCPPFLTEVGGYGTAAGQIGGYGPSAIAADPGSGHFFVGERFRIDEFDFNGAFVKAWGRGVLDGSPEPQICTAATGCLAGLTGTGAGEMEGAKGIAVDEAGNVWALDWSNRRVQKFTPGGEFLLMIGGEVNKTAVAKREAQEANAEPVTVTEAEENLCTAASGDLCGEGVVGTGAGQFGFFGENDPLAVGPDGTVYVGDVDRVQKFDEAGAFKGEIPLPGAGRTGSLSVTPEGRIYLISWDVKEKVGGAGNFESPSQVVREIGPAGEVLDTLLGSWEGKKTPKDPVAVTTDADGNVYVSAKVVYAFPSPTGTTFKQLEEVVAFDAAGGLINFEPQLAGFGRSTDTPGPISLATNVVKETGEPGEVFVGYYRDSALTGKPSLAYVRSFGNPFEVTDGPPEITDQFAASVSDTEASVEALINPRFTSDTTYQVQYGTGKCSEGGCESVAPVPAALLADEGNTAVATGAVSLEGLAPGTVYHFRFAAENKVTDEEGSGPVLGAEGTFTTFAAPEQPACANDLLRLPAGLNLPDCRAYEMVSPVDKEGGEIFELGSVPGFPAEVNQAAVGGEDMTYSSYRAFADPEAAPYTSQYLARRTAAGWSSESISPQREGTIVTALDSQYRAFSEDLSTGWLVTDSDPVLAPGGLPGYRNIYARDSAAGAYRAQCAAAPLEKTPAGDYRLEPQGFSADGSHLVFGAEGRLIPEAAPGKAQQVYECVNGSELRLVSVLPGGEASASGGSAGSAVGDLGGTGLRQNNVAGAVSDDGSRIFWTARPTGPGPLYARIDATTTVEIAAADAHFRVADPEGDRVIFTVNDELYEASVEADSASSTLIAGQVAGLMGTSEDTELVYLVSREDLDGGGQATAGEPNLYLYRAEADSFTFIGELSDADARANPPSEESDPVLTPVAFAPNIRSSRISADGLHAAFTSTAPLTGYDNTDRSSGQADTEVFVYDAGSGELLCASCNPSGARPQGRNAGVPVIPFWTAAHIPGWQSQHHAPRVMAEDGSRLFFEATDGLVLADTNGLQDVYQWQLPGSGSCTESSSTFSPANGGCIDLISSGKSPQHSELLDASADGADVFFVTTESLWAGDHGLADIYDARVEGGFPPPPAPAVPCQAGDGCQQRGAAPADTPPGSSAAGPGNVVEAPKSKPKRCRKGTHRVKTNGKTRCAKNKSKGKADKNRRARR